MKKELQPKMQPAKRHAARIKMRGKEMVIAREEVMRALGTGSQEFMDGVLRQLANAVSPGKDADEDAINFGLAVIAGVEPKDELETMLGLQMVAVHLATMTFTRRLAHVETIAQQDSAERALNRLMRTYVAQMEALKRYRTGGEQKVVVQHVNVNEGGQAIVGTVDRGRG